MLDVVGVSGVNRVGKWSRSNAALVLAMHRSYGGQFPCQREKHELPDEVLFISLNFNRVGGRHARHIGTGLKGSILLLIVCIVNGLSLYICFPGKRAKDSRWKLPSTRERAIRNPMSAGSRDAVGSSSICSTFLVLHRDEFDAVMV